MPLAASVMVAAASLGGALALRGQLGAGWRDGDAGDEDGGKEGDEGKEEEGEAEQQPDAAGGGEAPSASSSWVRRRLLCCPSTQPSASTTGSGSDQNPDHDACGLRMLWGVTAAFCACVFAFILLWTCHVQRLIQ